MTAADGGSSPRSRSLSDVKQTLSVAMGPFSELLGRGIVATLSEDIELDLTPLSAVENGPIWWPDVVILDGDRTQPSVITRIREASSAVGIVIFTSKGSGPEQNHFIDAHATCLQKEYTSPADLLYHVRRAARKAIEAASYKESHQSLTEAATTFAFSLTPREHEVLKCLTLGLTHRSIGSVLTISPETAKSHTANIRRKFGVQSNRELAVLAMELGLRCVRRG